MHNAKKYAVGSGLLLQTPIPLHTTSQKLCFWIPRMGVFEMHNANKYAVGSGVALQTPIPLHTTTQKLCFGSLGWVSLNCTMSHCPFKGKLHLHHGRTHLGPRTGGKMVCKLLLVTKTQCDVLAPVMVHYTTTQIAHLATYGCMVTACPPRPYLRQGAKQAVYLVMHHLGAPVTS